jgi:hypothetical protein
MANLFISYTSDDIEWTRWLCDELQAMGHQLKEFRQDRNPTGNIVAWMDGAYDWADHTLSVYSPAYEKSEYCKHEFEEAARHAITTRSAYHLIAKVRRIDIRLGHRITAHVDLWRLSEADARVALNSYIAGSVNVAVERPKSKRINPIPFPGRVPNNSSPFLADPIFLQGSLFRREDILKDIKAAFDQDDKPNVVALSGGSGAGKSTIAAAYAEIYRKHYRVCWWIRSASTDDLKADLAALAAQLGWLEPDEREGFREKQIIDRLKKQGKDILLIYDDAKDRIALERFLPRPTKAHILITSNAPDWAPFGENVTVRGWSREDGGEFLVVRVPAKNERATAESLSDAMEGLPLALEMAGAYCAQLIIAQDNSTLLAEYARQHQEKELQLFGDGSAVPKEYARHRTAAAAYHLAMEAANSRHDAAQSLLAHVALLAPSAIPLEIFRDGMDRLEEPLRTLILSDGLEEAVDALGDLGLISRPEDVRKGDWDIWSEHIHVHRAIRTIALATLTPEERESIRGAMIGVIEAAHPENDGQLDVSWPKARKLAAHASELLGKGLEPPRGFELVASDLMHKMSLFRGISTLELKKAKSLIDRSLDLRRRKLSDDDRRIAESLTTQALLTQAMNPNKGETTAQRDQRARDLAELAVSMADRLAGQEGPSIVGVPLINLARILRDTGGTVELETARLCCERARDLFRLRQPACATELAFALSVLGRILTAQGGDNLNNARAAIEEALDLYRKTFGRIHPAEANNLVNISDILMDQGEFELARASLEKARAIWERYVGPEAGGVAHCDGKLAETYTRERREEWEANARHYLRQSYDLSLKVLGPDHQVTRARVRQLRSLGLSV